jgi:acetyl-CoA carboxylase carboxyltransferase component/acetyl/propionyl-CoA carboxylase alpha subunit
MLAVVNRGEVAQRIVRTARDMGLTSVGVYAADDVWTGADAMVALPGRGPDAYLDMDAVLAAVPPGALVHPGYGFLAERAEFARRVTESGRAFVGPSPEVLELFGDKWATRALAEQVGLPVAPGSSGAITAHDALDWWDRLGGPLMVKAVGGGGGRGLRMVEQRDRLVEAVHRCQAEALAAFGRDGVAVERYIAHARHIEVQLVGDGQTVMALGTRDCTLQRRHQKVVEFAPAGGLPVAMVDDIVVGAQRLGAAVALRGVATVEVLVSGDRWVLLEVNPRLQVEHTVTEEVYGVDLVRVQLLIAQGASLADCGLDTPLTPRGGAVQMRLGASSGTVRRLTWPGGHGVRIDSALTIGTEISGRFDPLVAKVIVSHPSTDRGLLLARARRALDEIHLDGITSDLGMIRRLMDHEAVAQGDVHTRFVDDHLDVLTPTTAHNTDESVLVAPMPGTVIEVSVAVGDEVVAGTTLMVLESMKMHHPLTLPVGGVVREIHVGAGTAVSEAQSLLVLEPTAVSDAAVASPQPVDLDAVRPDLAEVVERHRLTQDRARPEAVQRRHAQGRRTARENLADLCDDGTYVEYGALVVAAQRRRRSVDDLMARTPADGMVAGIGSVNGATFGPDAARCAVVSYDYTVLAGTQGQFNHLKKDRLFELAERWRLPVVLLSEGGGGRPGDTDGLGVAGLDCHAFRYFADLSGLVPLVGVNAGYCFAGNAALLGMCDVVIATRDSNIGMGGPAMIEGGGLGVYPPTAIGPIDVQRRNGVVDVVVDDEPQAIAVAKTYLGYFQGPLTSWSAGDQRRARTLVPEDRLRAYDVRAVLELVADTGSVLELRRDFGRSMITALARLEGRPMGVMANDPRVIGGAIDSDAADKAARFLQLCDAYDLPVLSLCDTPGMMVGPEVEATALVRHCTRLFVTAASMTVPVVTVVLRKGYGLGAQAMAAGSFRSPLATLAWPTGEFGGMGLEGAVRLGYRQELDAVTDPVQRADLERELIDRMYAHGKAVNMAMHLEIDGVIDPADTRTTVARLFASVPPPPVRSGKKRPMIDTW